MKARVMLHVSENTPQSPSQPVDEADRRRRIRDLNDQLRTGRLDQVAALGRRLITRGVWALGPTECFLIMGKVKAFTAFDDGNDPWGEHDFGAFDHKGRKIFWKIDYYDRECEAGSPDPADPAVTCRVLTVLLADEY